MQIILNNGKELAIDIVMMAKQYAFYIFWASFNCRDKLCIAAKLNGCLMSHKTFFPWC
jgi:hypothetical protein